MNKEKTKVREDFHAIKSSVHDGSGNHSQIKQTKEEVKIEIQGGNSKLRDKLSFLIEMIDSGKRFAAWVEEEGVEAEEDDKVQFIYKKEWDTFEDKYGQSFNLNVLYESVCFGDVEVIVYPVSNQAKQFKDLLLYHLPEDCQYFSLEGENIVVHRDKPQKHSRFGWVSVGEIDFLPYAHLFTDLSEDCIYEIRRYEVSSFDDRELMFGDE